MNLKNIIATYYPDGSNTYQLLLIHSEQVAKKSVHCARHFKKEHLDVDFIWEAAMLHDIGIFMTYAPKIGCFGRFPYICHGYLGKKILEQQGLKRHARVCERHVGVGLTIPDIQHQNIPLPEKDMQPETIEEQIICYADKFYSKSSHIYEEKSIEMIERELSAYSDRSVYIFRKWHERFSIL
jgi:uncharacterized protein